MRPQVTVYLPAKTKKWLIAYAAELGLHRTDVVRCLLEHEMRVGWLRWAGEVPDPGSDRLRPTRSSRDKALFARRGKKR